MGVCLYVSVHPMCVVPPQARRGLESSGMVVSCPVSAGNSKSPRPHSPITGPILMFLSVVPVELLVTLLRGHSLCPKKSGFVT